MTSFQFSTAKSIINQPGGVRQIAEICDGLGVSKPLLVTDPGILSISLHDKALGSLVAQGKPYAVYSDVQADPSEAVLMEALDVARSENIDGVIGLGGGSSMDVAKLVASLADTDQMLADVFGIDKVKGERLPLIQIPTTAGTGSEVTPISVITTSEATKMGVVSGQLLPDVALLDAELTLGLPPMITAATGVDAMVHAIEAYTSVVKKNPYSDMLAREALSLMAPNIEKAVHQGDDLDARSAMMLGATLAGQAFANAPVAAVHALAYPLGGYYHIPHGLSNSLMLPHVLSFNAEAASHLYAELATVVLPKDTELSSADTDRTRQLIDYIVELIDRLGLPSTLSAVDVDLARLPALAKDAMKQERLLINNPRSMTEQDALNIYQAAYA